MLPLEVSDGYTRYAMSVPVRYGRVAGANDRLGHGWARDLNLRGAWVELPERVEPGSTLEITLATPVGNLSLVARVAWARLRDAPYLHGVYFTGVTPDLRDRLCALFAHEKPFASRLSCRLAATCERSWNGYPIPGIIRDLSAGGACVCLPQRVTPGAKLRIRAATPFGKIVADAQIAWADRANARLPRGRLCPHGLRFLHVDPVSELPLRALLYGVREDASRVTLPVRAGVAIEDAGKFRSGLEL